MVTKKFHTKPLSSEGRLAEHCSITLNASIGGGMKLCNANCSFEDAPEILHNLRNQFVRDISRSVAAPDVQTTVRAQLYCKTGLRSIDAVCAFADAAETLKDLCHSFSEMLMSDVRRFKTIADGKEK